MSSQEKKPATDDSFNAAIWCGAELQVDMHGYL